MTSQIHIGISVEHINPENELLNLLFNDDTLRIDMLDCICRYYGEKVQYYNYPNYQGYSHIVDRDGSTTAILLYFEYRDDVDDFTNKMIDRAQNVFRMKFKEYVDSMDQLGIHSYIE